MGRSNHLRYVLITPARNEEAYLEKTAQSVISQTTLPLKWMIISDGSTDRTDAIAKDYAARYPWIEYQRRPEHAHRNFAAKAECFMDGYQKVRSLEFDIIGNLDADLSFEPDYVEYLLDQFRESPDLGVAGTPFLEESVHYNYRFTNIKHVSGACQLFKRDCFDAIGGYVPIARGGIDWIAVTMARMKGWKTRTFTDKIIIHHRKMGTGKGTPMGAAWRMGQQDYFLGNHPLWEFSRLFYQMRFKPYILNGLILYVGYLSAALGSRKRTAPDELVNFVRREQMERLLTKIHVKKSGAGGG